MVNNVHSARIDVKGIASEHTEVLKAHAEAIALATGGETELNSTVAGGSTDD